MILRHLSSLFFLLVLFVVIGCATSSKSNIKEDTILLNEANEKFAKRDFMKAEEIYKKILDNFPESSYRLNALMGLADSLFRQDNYMESSWKYKEFYELYPVHQEAVKAHFFSGISNFFEILSHDRDQAATNRALNEFEHIVNNSDFKNTAYFEPSKNKIVYLKNILAKQTFQIGKYYFKTKNYMSSISRMEIFLLKHPNQSYEDEAIYILGESYFQRDNYTYAKKYFSEIMDQFASSSYRDRAGIRLNQIEKAGDRMSGAK